jgi:hypothetical protein
MRPRHQRGKAGHCKKLYADGQAAQLSEAITWWKKAGEHAGRQSTTVDSIRLLERALALLTRLQDQSVRKAEVLNLLGV